MSKKIGKRVFPWLPIPLKRQLIYFRLNRRFIPKKPVTFLEKVQWRILHDRRDLMAVGGDKIAMKEYAQRKSSDVKIPETLWTGTDLNQISSVDWGCEWVLKPREGSGSIAFGRGSLSDSGINQKTVQKWRHREAYQVQGMWGYGQSAPGFLIERRIPTADGDSPNDIRFFVFGGIVKIIQIDTPRFSQVQRRFYTPDWVPYEVMQGPTILGPVTSPPKVLSDMIRIAEEIGSDYDFVRIDLYDVPDGIYFGEITPYPTGGNAKFSDNEFDKLLGSWWQLPDIADVKRKNNFETL
ncbi:ATP-grasp fold amidoligase family protein [Corynebacterium glutamicum]|uniref:ATP-grasp fold amidoligase family protein n=1 Tax=Corynebacterium glutamicum TaxID=1718 RepID=UPI001B8B5F79|nr:ATP-grasp fold amidoligase family protein [Corynebacterium glutamicum]